MHLLDLGHPHLDCIAVLANSNFNDERIATYQHKLAQRGIPFDQALPRTRGYMLAAWVRESLVLLRLLELPTAIFAFNGLMAMRVMRAVQERGLRLPTDMAVIGFDGLALTEHCSPPLSIIEQPVAEMSAAAIAMLLDRIKEGASPARADLCCQDR